MGRVSRVPPAFAWALACCLSLLLWSGSVVAAPEGEAYPPMYRDAALFQWAMRQAVATPSVPAGTRVSGLTVPHHLLVAPLIAEGFARLRGQSYERIIILSPDHNSWGKTYFSVPGRDFATCLGPVPLDRQAVAALLGNPLVSVSHLFAREHGVQALLPFVAASFPGVPVVPITLRVRAGQPDWDSLADTLIPLLTPRTLIIQSTDFSHYLPGDEAAGKDQETLHVLSGDDPKTVSLLGQPEHLDSKAAQYLQLKLQRQVWGAHLSIEANANARDFMPLTSNAGEPQRTTSYIVQIYADHILPSRRERVFFGGDFFTGRHLTALLAQPDERALLVRRIGEVTAGAPLIVNFEGVLMDQCPDDDAATTRELRLCMPKETTLGLMRELNIVAVSLANNHIHDFGDEALAATRRALQQAGIAALGQGEMIQLPLLTLAAFTDVDNKHEPRARILQGSDFAALAAAKKVGKPSGNPLGKPLAIMLHYGREFRPAPDYRQQDLVDMLERRGADIIVGSHSHQPGRLTGRPGRIWAWSLGNFLFDQSRQEAGCALLELVFFPQGTYWARQHELGNLYNALRAGAGGRQKGPPH